MDIPKFTFICHQCAATTTYYSTRIGDYKYGEIEVENQLDSEDIEDSQILIKCLCGNIFDTRNLR